MPEQTPVESKPKRASIGRKANIAIPLAIFAFAAVYLVWVLASGGLLMDIDLKGGTQISFETQQLPTASAIENALREFDASARVARGVTTNAVIVTVAADVNASEVVTQLKGAGYDFGSYSEQSVGPALSSSFLQQAELVLMVAFIAMAITIFLLFKSPLPTAFMIFVGFATIVEALSFSQFLGVELSLATFAALLMIIGYSVDDNIMLTTRMLRGAEPDTALRVGGARRTGLTMIGATVAALAAMLLVQASAIITQIATVLLIALVIDLVNTYMLNVGLLRWYMERRDKK
jgi:preprotein translocase subunit SecF